MNCKSSITTALHESKYLYCDTVWAFYYDGRLPHIHLVPPVMLQTHVLLLLYGFRSKYILKSNHWIRVLLLFSAVPLTVLSCNAEVLPEQTDRDPAGPEDVGVLQATRGDDWSKDEWQAKGKANIKRLSQSRIEDHFTKTYSCVLMASWPQQPPDIRNHKHLKIHNKAAKRATTLQLWPALVSC